MLGPYIDTIIICTMTGLVIISTGAWKHTEFYVNITSTSIYEATSALKDGFSRKELFNSSLLTSYAFKRRFISTLFV